MWLRVINSGGLLDFVPFLGRALCALSSFVSSAANPSSNGCLAASASLLPRAVSADAAWERPHARCAKSRPPRCFPTTSEQAAICSSLSLDIDQQHFRAGAALAVAAAAAAAAWVGSSKQKRGSTRGKEHAARRWSSELRIDEHAAPAGKRAVLPSCFATAAAVPVFSAAAKGVYVGPPAACQQQQQQQSANLKQQLQQVALTRAFESIRHAVVQVYAVVPIHRDHVDAKSASQHVGEFHFLGSGFFFDDRGFIVTAAHVLMRPSDCRLLGEGPQMKEDPSKQQRTKAAGTAHLQFPVAVKDSNGRLFAASLCGFDEGFRLDLTVPFILALHTLLIHLPCLDASCLSAATDIAVLRLEGACPGQGQISSFQGKFSRSTPEIGEPVVMYAATQRDRASVFESQCNLGSVADLLVNRKLIVPRAPHHEIVFKAFEHHAEEPIGAVGRVLQPRQSFKSTSDSCSGRFLHLQLLTLPGMSGAPVCDLDGFVVGMLVKKFDACGLALPAPLVLRVAEALRDVGAFAPPSIGLLVEDAAPDFASKGDESLSPVSS
ncbi:hypothetical protein Esti_001153 [Eimeria stiedai]